MQINGTVLTSYAEVPDFIVINLDFTKLSLKLKEIHGNNMCVKPKTMMIFLFEEQEFQILSIDCA